MTSLNFVCLYVDVLQVSEESKKEAFCEPTVAPLLHKYQTCFLSSTFSLFEDNTTKYRLPSLFQHK